jgi:hypothetical protein
VPARIRGMHRSMKLLLVVILIALVVNIATAMVVPK